MVDFRKLMQAKRSQRRGRSRPPVFFDGQTPYEKNRHYENALPEEAIMMSRRGTAKGYDLLRFGDRSEDWDAPVATINKVGVQFHLVSDAEQAWIDEVEDQPTRMQARVEMVKQWNWTAWEDLLPVNREFLKSLLWIPVDPLNPMEILAKAAL